MARDPYNVLQVARHAEPEVIEAAYKRLALKYHPDQNPDASATAHMQDLNWAYQILKDPAKRARYDRGVRPQAAPKPPPAQSKPPPPKPPPVQPKPPPPKPRPPPPKPQAEPVKKASAGTKSSQTNRRIILWVAVGILTIILLSFAITLIEPAPVVPPTVVPPTVAPPTVVYPTVALNDPSMDEVSVYNANGWRFQDSIPNGTICKKLKEITVIGILPGTGRMYEIECSELNVRGWVQAEFAE